MAGSRFSQFAMPKLRRVLLSATFLLLAGPLSAQLVGGQWETHWRFDGREVNDHLGASVSGAGDVDGDGIPDLIVGASGAHAPGQLEEGSAFVYSGATGGMIWQFSIPSWDEIWGVSVSGAGDVNADGLDDVIVGAFSATGLSSEGVAFVYSGATGALLWRFDGQGGSAYLGKSVSGAGDVDRDGFDDLIVGATGAPGGLARIGSAYVYSGATGTLIWQFDGQEREDLFGESVSGAGDVDGDGHDDVIVGTSWTDPGGLQDAGSAHVYSGATGALIWQFNGQQRWAHLGNSVSSAGDVDEDGFDDVIVGRELADPGGRREAGSAYIYSGATGTLIRQFDGAKRGDRLGHSVSGAGDADGDGTPDLIVGAINAPLTNGGSAYVFSGATGDLIRRFDGQGNKDRLGVSVSDVGDLNGDGYDEVIVGAYGTEPDGKSGAGSAFVYSFNPILNTDSVTISATSGVPVHLQMDFPSSEAGFAYAILASGTGIGPTTHRGLDIPLSPDHVFNRMTRGWNPPPLQSGKGLLNHNGDAQASLSGHPGLIPWIGSTIHLAAVSFDHTTLTGRISSIARYLTIVP